VYEHLTGVLLALFGHELHEFILIFYKRTCSFQKSYSKNILSMCRTGRSRTVRDVRSFVYVALFERLH